MQKTLSLTLTITLCFFSISANAEDWNQFRGSQTDGTSSAVRLPKTWSEKENIAWKVPLLGRGWSSPVVSKNRIWFTTSTDEGRQLWVVCYDAKTGKQLHNIMMFEVHTTREIHKTNTIASSTPYIENGRVYIHFGSYGTVCLDEESAKIIWQRRDLYCHHWRGPGSSPIIYKDKLILHMDGYDVQKVVALDKTTGKTIWETVRNDYYGTDDGDRRKAYATPLVITAGGKEQLISPAAKTTYAYDVNTGKQLWYFRYESHSVACRPIWGNGLVYLTTGVTRAKTLAAVDPTGTGDVTKTHVKWSVTKSLPGKPSFVLIKNRFYMMDDKGVLSCRDVKDGSVVWKKRVGGNYSASPIFGANKIYFFSEGGKTTVIAPADKYHEVAVNKLDAGSKCSFAVIQNDLIIRTTTHLYRISEEENAAATTTTSDQEAAAKFEGKKDQWRGYDRYTFEIEGRKGFVIVPKKPGMGNPWVWRARFPNYRADINQGLLEKGVYVAYFDVSGLYGSPKAVALGNKFYDHVATQGSLCAKPALFGVSRGGLFVYNWALANPKKVACIYLDTPVLDFKSWPGGKGKGAGSEKNWKECLKAYGLTEEEALAYKKNPVDRANEITSSLIWIQHIVSDNDQVVPPAENTDKMKSNLPKRFRHYRLRIIRVKKGTEKSNGHHFDHPNKKAAINFLVKFALFEGGAVAKGSGKTLKQIDEIYSTIPPLKYTPPKVRGTKISKTLAKLKTDGEVRIVMLGDSIVNDTSASGWERLLQRDFPKCKVTKFTSVRGSTGCWWYQEKNRVQAYVLDQKPDLVIIGGISQQDNIDAIRTVIKKTRAGKPDTEFLLMTGAFGAGIDPAKGKKWYSKIDPKNDDYRSQLQALAKETNVEFLDMRGAWGDYMAGQTVKTAGRDVEWFKRDVVHANDKGKQVIGRILYRYLKP